MRSWMDELSENELECVRITLKASVESNDIGMALKQHARLMLNEVEDYLWNNVCRNIPASSDQLQADQQ